MQLSRRLDAANTVGVFIEGDAAKRLVEGFNAPLGTFSTRNTAAFSLGLISEREFKEIEILRRIRNRFAHHVHASFETQETHDLCFNLKMAAQDYGDVTVNARGRFTTAATALILNLTNRLFYVARKRLKSDAWPT